MNDLILDQLYQIWEDINILKFQFEISILLNLLLKDVSWHKYKITREKVEM